MGSVCKTALITSQGQGASLERCTLLCVSCKHTACGNIWGPQWSLQPKGMTTPQVLTLPTTTHWRIWIRFSDIIIIYNIFLFCLIFIKLFSNVHWLMMQIKVLNKGHMPRQPFCFCFTPSVSFYASLTQRPGVQRTALWGLHRRAKQLHWTVADFTGNSQHPDKGHCEAPSTWVNK